TRMIRLFLFDKSAPDPVREWPMFASYVQAVLDVGAVPMITFAKLRRPLDDPRAIRWFATQCSDVVWSCIEQWGGETVRDWHWCGDWREHGEQGAPLDGDVHRALMLSVTAEYEARARAIGSLISGRGMLNICGELNTHSHYWTHVRERFNYSVFSAAFYTSA